MANKGSTGDFERAAEIPLGRTATSAEPAGITDGKSGAPPGGAQKRREPLHAFIVHFDAEPSSKPR